jgi:hypothetical protein
MAFSIIKRCLMVQALNKQGIFMGVPL